MPIFNLCELLESISQEPKFSVKREKLYNFLVAVLNGDFGHSQEDGIEEVLNILRYVSFYF